MDGPPGWDPLRWDPQSPLHTSKVPWDADRDWEACRFSVIEAVGRVQKARETSASSFNRFFQHQLAFAAFDANRMEGTIGGHLRQEPTVSLIHDYLSGSEAPPEEPWPADGSRTPNERADNRQLYQFTMAAKYLLVDNLQRDLSVELICDVHDIMMKNAYDLGVGGEHVPLAIGRLRREADEHVYAGDNQYLSPFAVPGAVEALVETYNARSSSILQHSVSAATWLFYNLLAIHPFMNGNGRLCRLFLAWSLLRDGFPFPVDFSSGHAKARQHYFRAILLARRVDNRSRGELNAILLESMSRVLANFETNAGPI